MGKARHILMTCMDKTKPLRRKFKSFTNHLPAVGRFVFWLTIFVFCFLLVIREILPRSVAFDSLYQINLNSDIPARRLFESIWQNAVNPLAAFLNANANSIFSWPVAAVIVCLVFARSERIGSFLPHAAARLRKFDLFGLNVELADEMRGIYRDSEDISAQLPLVRSRLSDKLDVEVRSHAIDEAFVSFVTKVSKVIKGQNSNFLPLQCRATIHIEDALFPDQLMQLLEYHDGCGTRKAGKKAGRAFSIRRGIIGRVWRSELPEVAGVLPQQIVVDSENKHKMIAQIWGMTQKEAVEAEKYPSYICVPFNYGNGERRGTFYMDSVIKNAFIDPTNPDRLEKDDLCRKIVELLKKSDLPAAVSDLARAMSPKGPQFTALE